MPAQTPQDDTPDPREQELSRRSQTPAVGGWVVILGILLAAAVAYAAFALF